MGFFKPVDYWKMAENEDIVTNDNYPDTSESDWMINAGMICDLMRSLGKRDPWILMEQSPTHVNWRQRNPTKRPGVMRLCSYQAIARGANGVMFFQWRASKFGSEKHHSAMLPHAGTDTRIWREITAFGKELKQLTSLSQSRVKSEVAIMLSWDNWWALELDGKPSNDLRMIPQITSFYSDLFQKNITVDFIHPQADLRPYRVVIAPNLYLVTDEETQNIIQYVNSGGQLIMSFFSGIVDENDQIRLGGYPAPFREMLGLWIEEFAPYRSNDHNFITTKDLKTFQTTFWNDVIHLEKAQSLANFDYDYFKGSPAITKNTYGMGNAYYLGTQLEPEGMSWFLDQVCQSAGIQPLINKIVIGLEVIHRETPTKIFQFFLNHSDKPVQLKLAISGIDLLSNTKANGQISIAPSDFVIIMSDKQND